MSPKKKVRVAAGQSSLDNFFGTSSSRDSQNGSPEGKSKQENAAVQFPSDEAYAWALAKEDGLDLDMLRRLEKAESMKTLSLQSAEVIDVDLLDDGQSAHAGPSTRAARSIERSIHEPLSMNQATGSSEPPPVNVKTTPRPIFSSVGIVRNSNLHRTRHRSSKLRLGYR
ncbi:hypothetical protein A0H81_11714 [Grifola frondosa]|uniref:Uncharacterized protein n=1 Tax=Grifola frondosa TaxID=5627 RepID=A0A1C7LTK5_GRIFR|nr:hypothetical protein A0H81_11714 [Grifola frondosa]